MENKDELFVKYAVNNRFNPLNPFGLLSGMASTATSIYWWLGQSTGLWSRPHSQGKMKFDLHITINPACNHTKMCHRICYCRLIAVDLRMYIDCVSANKSIIFGNSSLPLKINLLLICLPIIVFIASIVHNQ